MSGAEKRGLKKDIPRRYIGSGILLCAAACLTAASSTGWARVGLTMTPNTSSVGVTPEELTIASLTQQPTPVARAFLLALAMLAVAVAVGTVTGWIAPQKRARATAMIAAAVVATLIARIWTTVSAIKAASSSYPVNFPHLRSRLDPGTWLSLVGLGLLVIGGLIFHRESSASSVEERRSRWLAAAAATSTVAILSLVVLATQDEPSKGQIVGSLQATATESAVLKTANYVGDACGSGCGVRTDLAHVEHDDHYTIEYVAGDQASPTEPGKIIVSISLDNGGAGGSSRAGLATLSDSGLCIFLAIVDVSEHERRYGTTADPGSCTGDNALLAATSMTPTDGGWLALQGGSTGWPSPGWTTGPAFSVYTGV